AVRKEIKSMKVLYINSHLAYADDGSGVHAREFVKWAARLGAQIATYPHVSRQPIRVNKRLRAIRRRLPPSVGEMLIYARERVLANRRRRAVLELTAGFRPDVVLTRSVPFDFLGLWIARRLGIPCVLEANGVIGTDQAEMFGRAILPLMRREELRQWQNVDQIIALSSLLRTIITESGIDSGKIHVVPLGYDHEMFSPLVSGRKVRNRYELAGKKILGFVGNVGQWHGPDEMARIFAEVVRAMDDVHLLIVGADDDRDSLAKGMCSQRIEPERVIQIGNIPFADVPEHIAAFDAALFYESRERPFSSPIKVFEYMGSGKATIGPDKGQCPELFAGGRGVLARHCNPDSFIQTAIELLKQDDRRREIGRRAAQRARSNYTWEHKAERVLRICREATDHRQ
ncbi:MAG: glycosyltransferase family 4 protein, partial [Candidatus Hydrogenedentota bacterium]